MTQDGKKNGRKNDDEEMTIYEPSYIAEEIVGWMETSPEGEEEFVSDIPLEEEGDEKEPNN